MSRGKTTKFLFNDGEYFVALTDKLAVRVGMVNGTRFDVPVGSAKFARVARAATFEAVAGPATRQAVEALHDELTSECVS